MLRGSSTNRTRAAVVAASRRWQEAAVHIRGELRAFGVHGQLRRLNDFAAGHRGTAAARQIATLVQEARDGGLPAHVIANELGTLTAGIIADVYAAREGDAA